ncbi:hypothetical protein D0869_13577 [Hortaea werneckii]|uniref:DUF1754-domain-containing protein n=1 Tax=Hortaea werneckii TaxID=91943 RepID=A0A3M6W4M2_HORWE|nr:hypothetical protein KC324_g7550 [Hortaea werneckii]KAI7581677.1 hypothetical protein KC316_g8324 [Hortaea werneckii]RMX73463.1 hypothetical protein D0869_13577 [Hortaea werneckii]RMX92196.1 hypothetical protein D0868_13547 [Hortaea werneckii]
MPSADYGNAVGGGLKLKGAKDAGVKKKKKEKKSKAADAGDGDKAQQNALQKALADEDKGDDETGGSQVAGPHEKDGLKDGASGTAEHDDHKGSGGDHKDYGKTEAQKKQEELRRKRLEERLRKEGIKTHKERVEELNKYLSGLSEHHDMPRIGPG